MSNNDLKKNILNNFNNTMNENLEKLIKQVMKDINQLNLTLANKELS